MSATDGSDRSGRAGEHPEPTAPEGAPHAEGAVPAESAGAAPGGAGLSGPDVSEAESGPPQPAGAAASADDGHAGEQAAGPAPEAEASGDSAPAPSGPEGTGPAPSAAEPAPETGAAAAGPAHPGTGAGFPAEEQQPGAGAAGAHPQGGPGGPGAPPPWGATVPGGGSGAPQPGAAASTGVFAAPGPPGTGTPQHEQAWSGPPSGAHAHPGHTPPPGHPGGGYSPGPFGPGPAQFEQGGFGPAGPPPPWGPPGAAPPGDGGGPKRSRSGTIAIAAVTALVTSLIVGPAAAVATSALAGGSSPISSLADGGQAESVSTGSVSKVAEKVLPSVVSIDSGGAGGSGVVISSNGQILTNAHVVAGAEGDTVAVQFNDGTEAEAKILGTDPVSDLAVIEASGVSDLTPATLGNSDKVEVGADVVAIGSPLGLSGTVTSGVVSAVDRPVNTGNAEGEQQPQDPFGGQGGGGGGGGGGQQGEPQTQTSTVISAIQTDAPINPGNSGGPLINMNGEVIGVNTAIAGTSSGQGEAGSIGLGFAIPANQAKPIAEQLIESGTSSYAAIDATVSGVEGSTGVRIVEAGKDGAAAEAGLKDDDVITTLEGAKVEGPDDLIAKIRSHRPGDTVAIGYERDGKEQESEVTLSEQSLDSIGD
ncbi:S1C family serine protease [Nocardiopsis coralliicola]